MMKKQQQKILPVPTENMRSTHVRIDNLQRPLHIKGFLQWLFQTCNISVKEADVWINSIKTHCYIDFDTVEDAEKCITAVTGKSYPVSNNCILCASYTSISAKQAPTSEEANMKPNEWRYNSNLNSSVPGSNIVARIKNGIISGDDNITSSGSAEMKNAALKRKLTEAMESIQGPSNIFKKATVSATTISNQRTSYPMAFEEKMVEVRKTVASPSITWCPVSNFIAQTRIKLFKHRMGTNQEKS